jgi:hypothetical protein
MPTIAKSSLRLANSSSLGNEVQLSMNPAAMSALAVFGGASVGSLSPVLSNYVLQRRVARRDLINREIAERQRLYSDFISEAAVSMPMR